MAKVIPFKGLRFTERAGSPHEFCCPPYDIIPPAMQDELYGRCANNVIRLELPRGEDKYAEAGRTLRAWMDVGILALDDRASLYIYEEEFSDRKCGTLRISGVIARVGLEPFSSGVILPHEDTLSKAKTDRFSLMTATGCNFSQIYSLYNDSERSIAPKLDKLAAGTPDVEFTDGDGVTHRLWAVPECAETAEICRAFESHKLYIADGHHRYETALNYRDAMLEKGGAPDDVNYVMMMLVDMNSDGLVVYPTHRLVKDISDFDAERTLEAIGREFDVETRSDVDNMETLIDSKNALAMYCGGGKYHLLTLRCGDAMRRALPDASDAYRSLDVSVLHSLILEPLLAIDRENMLAQRNLAYTRDVCEAIAEVDGGGCQCAFILGPTRVPQIRDVSLAGEKMPQKSTYFYPKLITGLVMNKIN